MVKHLPAMWETWVRFLDQEDPLEKEMATHSSVLSWKIPWTEEPGRLQSMGSQRVRHVWATSLHITETTSFTVGKTFIGHSVLFIKIVWAIEIFWLIFLLWSNHFLPPYFFNWRIIALRDFVVFCHTSTRISCRHTGIPSLPNLPPISLPSPPFQIVTEPLSSLSHRNFPLTVCFIYGIINFHVTLYIHSLLPPPSLSKSLFSMSVSHLLP